MFPGKFNYSTRSIKELAARRAIRAIEGRGIHDLSKYIDEKSPRYKKMVNGIAKDWGVITLKCQRLDDIARRSVYHQRISVNIAGRGGVSNGVEL